MLQMPLPHFCLIIAFNGILHAYIYNLAQCHFLQCSETTNHFLYQDVLKDLFLLLNTCVGYEKLRGWFRRSDLAFILQALAGSIGFEINE